MDFNELLVQKLKEQYPEAEDWWSRAKALNITLEEYLYRIGKVDPVQLLEAKSAVLHFPKATLGKQIAPLEILQLIPENITKLHQIVALKKTDKTLEIGAVTPQNPDLDEILGFLRNSLQLEPKLFVISLQDFYKALRSYHLFSQELKKIIEEYRKGRPMVAEKPITLSEGATVEDAPVIKLVEIIFNEAVSSLASDIHLEPAVDRMRIRFRLNGELKVIGYLPKDLHYQIVNRVKVLARLKLDETRIPQDGRIRLNVAGREIDFRIGILPTVEGEKASIRILDPVVGLKRLEDLGLSSYYLEKTERALAKPVGLILMTGPTGSGKTTTLYAMLQEINAENINVISLEDPVEYRMDGINQSQVKPEIQYTFSTGLRELLRQDPDVILVGEIRDKETAELAIHSALTGHLVLSTLHTNDALSSITRLLDIGIERFLLSPTLQFLLAQRLVRELCDCKKPVKAAGSIEDVIAATLASLPPSIKAEFKFEKPYTVYRPGGCDQCRQRGFIGRLGIFEIIEIDDRIRKGLEEGESELELHKYLPQQEFVSLRQDGVLKALRGQVVLEEVIQATP